MVYSGDWRKVVMNEKQTLKKAAIFTDIHLGKKSNSKLHNEDCLNYIEWFADQIKQNPSIDHIWFLGDWHEQRSAIDGLTLKYSYTAAKRLNDIGLKIFFLLGNHDLYLKNNRNIYTTEIFSSLNNFNIIKEITTVDEIYNSVLAIPFLMEDEYSDILEYRDIPVAMGHLELAGFTMSGTSNILESGPDHEKFFKNKKRVFSGHFHLRQKKDNIHYIGNTFPMDYSDANDTKRGMAVYDFENDKLEYIDWPDCPRYIKTKLSDILASPKKILHNNAYVKVLVDQTITLTESNEIKKLFSDKFNLREIVLEEKPESPPELSEIEQEIEDLKLETVSEIVPELLKRVKGDRIKSEKLVGIYKEL